MCADIARSTHHVLRQDASIHSRLPKGESAQALRYWLKTADVTSQLSDSHPVLRFPKRRVQLLGGRSPQSLQPMLP